MARKQKNDKTNQALPDQALSKINAGVSLGAMASGVKQDLEHAGSDALKTAQGIGQTLFDPGFKLVEGAAYLVKDAAKGVFDSGRDLFEGKIGDAAKALVAVPTNIGKDAVKSVVSAGDALDEGLVKTASSALKLTVDASPIGVVGAAAGLTPRVDSLIDSASNIADETFDGIGKLIQDVSDSGVDLTTITLTSAAQSFDDLSKGKIGKAIFDPITVPISTAGKDARQVFHDATDPKTAAVLLATAGIAAAAFTGGASADETEELIEAAETAPTAEKPLSQLPEADTVLRLPTAKPLPDSLSALKEPIVRPLPEADTPVARRVAPSETPTLSQAKDVVADEPKAISRSSSAIEEPVKPLPQGVDTANKFLTRLKALDKEWSDTQALEGPQKTKAIGDFYEKYNSVERDLKREFGSNTKVKNLFPKSHVPRNVAVKSYIQIMTKLANPWQR